MQKNICSAFLFSFGAQSTRAPVAAEPRSGWPSEWDGLPGIADEYALERLQWGDKAGALIQIPAQLAAASSLLTPFLLHNSYSSLIYLTRVFVKKNK